ncbi:MAG: hypothetical protein GSR77_04425 [Desulfurococcales archaeon]|nr:hypothetical protein [Desulfurococcales archaeon]
MTCKKLEITYTIANLLEQLTRYSTETSKPPNAFRAYARRIKVNERSVYKLLNRAYKLGFALGISINYARLGAARFLLKFDEEPEKEPRFYAKYLTLEGSVIYDLYLPVRCQMILEEEYPDAEIYRVDAEWGARHALASLGVLNLNLDEPLPRELRERMEKLYVDQLARGVPRYFFGRHYPFDPEIMALLVYAKGHIGIESISGLARKLGFNVPKMQRKFYTMWERRSIMGYTIEKAPYYTTTNIILSVNGGDPQRTVYAAPVLLGVYSGMLATHKNRNLGLIWLKIDGIIAAELISIIKEYSPNVKIEGYFYLKEANTDYLRNLPEIYKECYQKILNRIKSHH